MGSLNFVTTRPHAGCGPEFFYLRRLASLALLACMKINSPHKGQMSRAFSPTRLGAFAVHVRVAEISPPLPEVRRSKKIAATLPCV